MNKSRFDEIVSDTHNQLLLKVNNEIYYINVRKKLVFNELGVIAVNERTGSVSIVLFSDIDDVISDGEKID